MFKALNEFSAMDFLDNFSKKKDYQMMLEKFLGKGLSERFYENSGVVSARVGSWILIPRKGDEYPVYVRCSKRVEGDRETLERMGVKVNKDAPKLLSGKIKSIKILEMFLDYLKTDAVSNSVMENHDQLALVRWIAAGLRIPEVRRLHGDASYLLSNMIAKYMLAASEYCVSEMAFRKFEEDSIDFEFEYFRKRFYGGNSNFIYEHPVPASVIRSRLLEGDSDEEAVRKTLEEAGVVTVLLRSEDSRLNSAGYRSKMPVGWVWGDNPFARYESVDIKISSKKLKVKGGIVR